MPSPASPLLSVIVPVAMGREPYTKLFAWLSKISEHNLEVIMVLDEFSQKADSEFLFEIDKYKSHKLLLHKGSFGSPGSARNFGLKSAHGKWVAFWDSDDSPNLPRFLEMVATADSENSEVAIGSFVWRSELNSQTIKTFTNPANLDDLVYSIGRTPGIWRFAIRRDLLKHPFSALRMAEDQEFILSNKLLSHKVLSFPENIYEYFTGGENHQTKKASNFEDLEKAIRLSYMHYSTTDDNLNRKLASLFWLQQFGSNLKYGKKWVRLRTLTLGLKQFVTSDFQFKRSQLRNSVRLIGNQKKSMKVIVPLTGGLGNQLFQLTAAMAIAKGSRVGLDSTIGAPRLNALGQPEVTSFSLPENVFLLPSVHRSKLLKKSSGYLLRIGVAPRTFESSSIYRTFVKLLWNILVAVSYRRLIVSTAGKGVGYFSLKRRGPTQLIYGYFQSYVWPEALIKQLQMIHPVDYSSELLSYRELSEIELPLVVHVRLGDYKLEKDFGIPSKRYYEEAISWMWETGEYKKIWIFSDEPNTALEYLPRDLQAEMRWIPEVDSSASQTLEAMRFGKGFVIGNSTFSWWGAFLAYNLKARVIAPKPWFKFGESPRALLPPGWKSFNAFDN